MRRRSDPMLPQAPWLARARASALACGVAGGLAGGLAVSDAWAEPDAAPVLREGDIFTEPVTTPGSPLLRGVAYSRHRTWPDGVMPVWLSPALDRRSRDVVRDAISVWNDVAGVRIDELADEPDPRIDHVRFEPGDGCASWVGRRGGAQSLWVAPACNRGSVLHELGHALGLEHEHTRSDRDAWILIHWDRIAADKRHNFERAPDGDRLLGAYDYASIMHYGPDFFGIDGATTIEPLDPSARIGQRDAPSVGDIAALAELYGTDLSLSADLFAEIEGDADGRRYALDVRVTNEGGNGAHDVRIDTVLPSGWRFDGVLATDGAWRCSGVDTIGCTRERLPSGALASLSIAVRAHGASDSDDTSARRSQAPDQGAGTTPPIVIDVSAGVHDATAHNDRVRLERVAAERDDLGEPTLAAADAAAGSDGATTVAWPGNGNGGLGSVGAMLFPLLAALARRRRRIDRGRGPGVATATAAR